jgi:hypothetical protein
MSVLMKEKSNHDNMAKAQLKISKIERKKWRNEENLKMWLKTHESGEVDSANLNKQ